MPLALPEVDGFSPSLPRAFAFVVPLKATRLRGTSAQALADAARSQGRSTQVASDSICLIASTIHYSKHDWSS